MLNQKNLAIVRAALQFLDEEFSSDDEDLFQHYLDDRGVLTGAGTKDINATRAKLDTSELYTAMKYADEDKLVSTSLIPMIAENEVAKPIGREQPVSVIVTGC